jgi:hypothetical protein
VFTVRPSLGPTASDADDLSKVQIAALGPAEAKIDAVTEEADWRRVRRAPTALNPTVAYTTAGSACHSSKPICRPFSPALRQEAPMSKPVPPRRCIPSSFSRGPANNLAREEMRLVQGDRGLAPNP